jgi:L-ascorbate metabolism protein UlaG (beta-lactamase superfamily)
MEFGDVKIDFLGHSGFIIQNGCGKRIAIDPYNISEDIDAADLILITHSHYDHCSIKDIQILCKKGTLVVIPADAQSKVTRINDIEMQIIESGTEFEFGKYKIQTVPAYNMDKPFHPKQEGWFGYLIKLGNTIIYHAGDTDKTSELSKLSGYGKDGNNFIALLPVSGKFVMTSEEAFEAAKLMKPNIAIPMHYGAGVAGTEEDAKRFVQLCNDEGIEAHILEKI